MRPRRFFRQVSPKPKRRADGTVREDRPTQVRQISTAARVGPPIPAMKTAASSPTRGDKAVSVAAAASQNRHKDQRFGRIESCCFLYSVTSHTRWHFIRWVVHVIAQLKQSAKPYAL